MKLYEFKKIALEHEARKAERNAERAESFWEMVILNCH